MSILWVSILWASIGILALAVPERGSLLAEQTRQYEAEASKSILELQQFRQANAIPIRSRSGREGVATLVNLNPTINTWYLLQIAWKDGAPEPAWHLENVKPHDAKLLLDEKYPSGLVIAEGNQRFACELFGSGSTNVLDQGGPSPLIYQPLCEGRLYRRHAAKGHRTALEWATEFLRDQVWDGEKVIVLFHHLMADRYRETSEIQTQSHTGASTNSGGTPGELPLSALIDPRYADRLVKPGQLGIALDSPGAEKDGMLPGAWYSAAGNPGIHVSVLQLNFIAPAILQSGRSVVNNLDSVEAASLVYLVAFDLDRFELAYVRGTEHPEVDWADRIPGRMINPQLPGPDGIGSIAPLVSTGLIRPDNSRKTVAAFTGGFKRAHGAFKYGELALRNHGSHYGFIENGVVFSKLQPGLATLFTLDDGSVEMKTWTAADNQLLARISHARQNGVPLVEFDEASKSPVPGRLVARWGPGNWSGSEDEHLRTIRAGIAIEKIHGKRFLIYAVFSDATPSGMARAFQAYGSHYAMLLDMNALEHTYLAVYRRSASELTVDHLLKGMSQLDKSASGENVPRFLGYADNRDFFYMMRRDVKGGKP